MSTPLPNPAVTRRDLLKLGASASLGAMLPPLAAAAPARSGIIEAENRRPGTTDWQLTFVRSQNFRSEMIEGYCSRTSVRAGEKIDIHLSAKPADRVTIDVYRIGYYGGKGGRQVGRFGPFPVKTQRTPEAGPNRLRECAWDIATTLTIPNDWVSGVYVGKLSCVSHRYQSYIIFVVRDDRAADVMFQTSDTTWQAYNKWPEKDSMYDSDPPHRPVTATTRVSYDRPYGKYPQVVDSALSQGSGEFLLWEYPLCYWLEQHGYDVTYTSNIDTHADAKGLARVKCFISVGHDEYWSLAMYDHVQAAIKNGLNVAFLCGNSVSFVVPLDLRNRQDRPHRLLYRAGIFGGVRPGWFDRIPYWKTEPWETHGPSENLLIGARTMEPANGSGNWIAKNTRHWLFEGTGMKDGDIIPGLVGWEHHGDPASIPGLEVVAEGHVEKADGERSPYAATIYPGPKNNWVFNAATSFWSMGLAQPPGLTPPYSHLGRPHGVDERVQTITSNFLRRCGVTPSQ